MFRANKDHTQGQLFGTSNLLPEQLKKRLRNHWSTTFYKQVFQNIDESSFAAIYSTTGRPNFPVNILAGLEILKEMFALSDEQLFDRYHFDFAFQNALGVEHFGDHQFAIRTLYHFRAAVAEYEEREGVSLFDHIFRDNRDRMIEEIGINTGAQRTDSVQIAANIKRMSRVSLFHKVFSNLVRELEHKKIKLSTKYTDYLKHDEDGFTWRLEHSRRDDVLQELGGFMRELILNHPQSLAGTKCLADAERLLGEQCTVQSGSVEIKPPDDISSGSMQNPADGDATYRNKRGESYQGYSAHAVETCDPDNAAQVITHVATVQNNVDDAPVLADSLAKINRFNHYCPNRNKKNPFAYQNVSLQAAKFHLA